MFAFKASESVRYCVEMLFKEMGAHDTTQDVLLTRSAVSLANRFPGFLASSQTDKLDCKLVCGIAEGGCGGKVPCKVAMKFDQMTAEKWNLEEACAFWIGHFCTDADKADIL